VFSYGDADGSPITLDPSTVPPSIDATELPAVLTVTVTASLASLPGQTAASSMTVPVTGNVYQSSTDGNG
jgi:hypothetical protein